MHNMICDWCIQGRLLTCFWLAKFRFVKNLTFGIFSGTVNVINVKLCMMVLLIECYRCIPLSVTLTIIQGHSNVEHFKLKIVCSYPIKFKLYRSDK